MTLTEAIKIVVDLRGHEIIAYLLDLGQSLDLIFGAKSATEVEGKVDFVSQEFTFNHPKSSTKTDYKLQCQTREMAKRFLKWKNHVKIE